MKPAKSAKSSFPVTFNNAAMMELQFVIGSNTHVL